MDIVVYLNNGQFRRYSQQDPALIDATIAGLQPNRVFASASVILGSGAACHFLKTSAISRIDVVTDRPFVHQPTFQQATVIDSEEAFEVRATDAAKALAAGVAPGDEYLGYLRFELAGGHRLVIDIQRVLQQQVQFFSNLHRLYEGSVMLFPHPLGGAVILNVANIVSAEAVPGFAEYPKGTIFADAS